MLIFLNGVPDKNLKLTNQEAAAYGYYLACGTNERHQKKKKVAVENRTVLNNLICVFIPHSVNIML